MPNWYRFGKHEVRTDERLLLVDGEPANIGARAFDVLLALIELRSRVVTKDELLKRVWPGLHVEENNLSAQVSALRRILGRDAIATVSGLGYRFTTPVECVDRQPSAAASVTPAPAPPGTGDERLRFGVLEWLPRERVALIGGRRADIGSRALDLLGVLIAERHRVVSKPELLERVWPGMVVEENNLQVQTSTLRKLLGQDAVATIPGRGYRFTMQRPADQARVLVAASAETQARTNLPHAQEALMGRADDLEQLDLLLKAHRLLTIVGVGGIGKTRVAQALARMQSDHFAHGVWWVDLGALASPDEVAPAIAAAARVQMGSGEPARQLALALQSRNMLLVLDNCEHLVEEVSRIAGAVLDVAGQVWLLATSQEPLRVVGEQIFRLDSLKVPPADASIDEARRCGALMLLERRAQAVSSNFALTEPMLPAAIELCRQLDGIPLAIEMAAARLPQMSTTALRAALGERLEWLRSGSPAAPARQQTLRATLHWSCSLLGPAEQVVLRRLAVFASSFPLESAQRVACDTGLDGWAVAEAMSMLVERSLVHVDDEDPPRYRLLETMRLYAAEQLRAHGETQSAKAAHMRLMAAIGEEAEQAYWITPDEPWLARYGAEYDDLHLAFVHACQARNATVGAATLDALYRLDELRIMPVSLAPRLPAAYALLPHADDTSALRIRLVLASPFVAALAVEGVSKLDTVRPAVEVARGLCDIPRLYRALMNVVVHGTVAGDEGIVAPALAEAEALEEPSWPPRLRWLGALHRSLRHALRGDSAALMSSLRSELAFAEQAGSAVQALNARINVADASLMCREVDQAIRFGVEAAEEARSRGLDGYLACALPNLCAALIVAGELRKAAEIAAEAIELVWRHHDRLGYLLDHLSFLAALQGRFEDSLLLIGFTDAWWAAVQYAREGNEAAAVQRAMAANEKALGVTEAAHLRKLGARLDMAEARRLAQACIGSCEALQRRA